MPESSGFSVGHCVYWTSKGVKEIAEIYSDSDFHYVLSFATLSRESIIDHIKSRHKLSTLAPTIDEHPSYRSHIRWGTIKVSPNPIQKDNVLSLLDT